ELDLDQVRRSRSRGLKHLGQVLKSFRDRTVEFPIYQPGHKLPFLESLGPLQKPTRRRPAGDRNSSDDEVPPKPPGDF
ncbi:MAG: carbon-nitrogen hydrolase family protein, partial [Anaerolineae bacterium]|nr:carbon-nitrogen hydrolase family protein [Anaerolineae bacterium]